MPEIVTELSDNLFKYLQKDAFVLLGTMDAESGGPANNAISWIYAVDSRKIRFAVDQRSRIITNIRQNPNVSIVFFASGTVNAVFGKAAVLTDALEDVPFKLACIDVDVDLVRDVMFYGSRISVEPEFEKTYDKRAADKLDLQVFGSMKKA